MPLQGNRFITHRRINIKYIHDSTLLPAKQSFLIKCTEQWLDVRYSFYLLLCLNPLKNKLPMPPMFGSSQE